MVFGRGFTCSRFCCGEGHTRGMSGGRIWLRVDGLGDALEAGDDSSKLVKAGCDCFQTMLEVLARASCYT